MTEANDAAQSKSYPLSDRQQTIVDEFSDLEGWEERYRRIIELGRSLPTLAEERRGAKHRVRGCQSQVWLHAALNDDGSVKFEADSDAMIVRGLISLLLRCYNGAHPLDILQTPPHFVEDVGLSTHLSPTRSNGLRSMVEQMMYYAKAFAAMAKLRN